MTKSERLKKMRADNDTLYQRLGWKPGKKESPNEIPTYKTSSGPVLSNRIPAHGPRKHTNRYSGDELLGIATMHKSNAVPIRKDAAEQAKEVSAMRRG